MGGGTSPSAPRCFSEPHSIGIYGVFAEDSFATNLEEIGLLGKTVVNATPWATETDNGETVTYAPITPQRFNEIMPKYYGHLSGLGLKVTAPDPAVVIARSDHKWGRSPIPSYIDEVYSNLLDSTY